MVSEIEKSRPVRSFRRVGLLLLMCILVGAACFLAGRYGAGKAEKEPEISAVVLENCLTEISELASVTYNYTNMAQFENSSDFYGVKLPFTTKKFILTYDGIIKAGIDLSKAQVETSGKVVRVYLPEPQILSHEIDEGSMEIFDEKTSIFNPFTVEDFTAFQAEQKAVMEEKALERGLLEEADAKATDAVWALLSAVLPEDAVLTVSTPGSSK